MAVDSPKSQELGGQSVGVGKCGEVYIETYRTVRFRCGLVNCELHPRREFCVFFSVLRLSPKSSHRGWCVGDGVQIW